MVVKFYFISDMIVNALKDMVGCTCTTEEWTIRTEFLSGGLLLLHTTAPVKSLLNTFLILDSISLLCRTNLSDQETAETVHQTTVLEWSPVGDMPNQMYTEDDGGPNRSGIFKCLIYWSCFMLPNRSRIKILLIRTKLHFWLK